MGTSGIYVLLSPESVLHGILLVGSLNIIFLNPEYQSGLVAIRSRASGLRPTADRFPEITALSDVPCTSTILLT